MSHASRIRSYHEAPCIALVVKACPRILDCPALLYVEPWSRLCSNSPKLMVQRASLGSRSSGTLLDGNGSVVLKSSGISNGVEADATARLCVRGAERLAAGDSTAEAAASVRKTAIRREDPADVIELTRDRGRRRRHDR